MEPLTTSTTALTYVLVLVLLLISGSAARHSLCTSSTGPIFAKIHPATYLAVIAVLMRG